MLASKTTEAKDFLYLLVLYEEICKWHIDGKSSCLVNHEFSKFI